MCLSLCVLALYKLRTESSLALSLFSLLTGTRAHGHIQFACTNMRAPTQTSTCAYTFADAAHTPTHIYPPTHTRPHSVSLFFSFTHTCGANIEESGYRGATVHVNVDTFTRRNRARRCHSLITRAHSIYIRKHTHLLTPTRAHTHARTNARTRSHIHPHPHTGIVREGAARLYLHGKC